MAGEIFGWKSRRVGKRNTLSALANLVRNRPFRQLCNVCYRITVHVLQVVKDLVYTVHVQK